MCGCVYVLMNQVILFAVRRGSLRSGSRLVLVFDPLHRNQPANGESFCGVVLCSGFSRQSCEIVLCGESLQNTLCVSVRSGENERISTQSDDRPVLTQEGTRTTVSLESERDAGTASDTKESLFRTMRGNNRLC